jgi:RNA polymerase sigma-70 factor (ECF subfamily)
MTDHDDFEALWRAHFDRVLRFAARRCEVDAAWDVAAETFTIAWRRRRDLPADALPYLLGIATKVLSHHHRGAKRRGALVERLSVQPVVPSPGVDAVVDLDPIVAAMKQLGPADREAIVLTAWDDLTVAQAAQVAGCSANAFSVRLHRARQRLLVLVERSTPPSTDAPKERVHEH